MLLKPMIQLTFGRSDPIVGIAVATIVLLQFSHQNYVKGDLLRAKTHHHLPIKRREKQSELQSYKSENPFSCCAFLLL
jgi:hypothetical protein